MQFDFPEYLQSAHALLEAGEYTQACSELKLLHRSKPDNIHLLSMLAYAHMEINQPTIAENYLRQAIGLKTQSDWAYYTEAQELFQKGRVYQARQAALRAISANPKQTQYFAFAGQVELSLGNAGEATKLAMRGLELEPDNLACENVRILALEIEQDVTAAKEAYETLIARMPNHAPSFAHYGWFLLRWRRWNEAMDNFRTALSIDLRNVTAAEGLIEGFKNRYWPLRMITEFLRLFVPSSMTKIGVMLGIGWFGYLVLFLAWERQGIGAISNVLALVYSLYVYFSLAGEDLTNLLPMLFREGRAILANHLKVVSSLILGIPGLGFAILLLGRELDHTVMQVFGISLMLSIFAVLSAVFRVDRLVRAASAASLVALCIPFVLSVIQPGHYADWKTFIPLWGLVFTAHTLFALIRKDRL